MASPLRSTYYSNSTVQTSQTSRACSRLQWSRPPRIHPHPPHRRYRHPRGRPWRRHPTPRRQPSSTGSAHQHDANGSASIRVEPNRVGHRGMPPSAPSTRVDCLVCRRHKQHIRPPKMSEWERKRAKKVGELLKCSKIEHDGQQREYLINHISSTLRGCIVAQKRRTGFLVPSTFAEHTISRRHP